MLNIAERIKQSIGSAVDSIVEHFPEASRAARWSFIFWDHVPLDYFSCHYIQNKIYVVCDVEKMDMVKQSDAFKDFEIIEDENEKTRILIDIGFLIEVQNT